MDKHISKKSLSTAALLGISELLILITRTPNFTDMHYPMRFLLSVSLSMFFILTGYRLSLTGDFLTKLIHDARSILLPLVLVIAFVRSGLVFYYHQLYVLWILVGFYAVRTVYNALNLLFLHTRIRKQIVWTVMLLLGLAGMILGFSNHTALYADVILASFFPALIGLLARQYHRKYVLLPTAKILLLTVSAALLLFGIATGQFADPVNHRFPLVILGSAVSVAGAVLVIWAAHYALKLPVLRDICTTLGNHPVLTICVARLDPYIMRTWITAYPVVTTVLRTIADLALILAASLTVQTVRPTRASVTDHHFCLKYMKASDSYFYIAFTCILIRSALRQTMIRSFIPGDILNNFVYMPTTWIAYSLILVFAISLASVRNKAQFFLEAAVFAVTQIWYREESVLNIYFLLILILSATGKEFRKILKIFLFTYLPILILAWWGSLHGYVINLVYYRDKVHRIGPRYALGAGYVTDLASLWFYLITLTCIAKPKRRKWTSFIAYPVLLYIAYYIYHVTNARLNMIADFAVIFVTLLAHLRRCINTGSIYRKISSAAGYVFSFSYLFCTVLSFYLVANYNMETTDMPFQSVLGKFMNLHQLKERLRISKTALSEFSINLFGNYKNYTEVGQGGTFMQTNTITFLDISYIKIPFIYGILIFGILLILWTMTALRNAKQHHLFYVLILSIVAFTGLVEHHLFEYYYNIFSLAAFAAFSGPAKLKWKIHHEKNK